MIHIAVITQKCSAIIGLSLGVLITTMSAGVVSAASPSLSVGQPYILEETTAVDGTTYQLEVPVTYVCHEDAVNAAIVVAVTDTTLLHAAVYLPATLYRTSHPGIICDDELNVTDINVGQVQKNGVPGDSVLITGTLTNAGTLLPFVNIYSGTMGDVITND